MAQQQLEYMDKAHAYIKRQMKKIASQGLLTKSESFG
jgi:hypothetical protein